MDKLRRPRFQPLPTLRGVLARPLRELYWSRLGAPLRSVLKRPVPSAHDSAYWDSQVSGPCAPRLGYTLSVDTRNYVIAMLLRHWKSPVGAVLDVGCAGGTLARALAAEGLTRYVGVDISSHAIAEARLRVDVPSAEFVRASLQDFRSQETFDVVVVSEVLYCLALEDVAAVVERCFALMRGDGLLCVSLNQHPKGQAVQREVARRLRFVAGFVWQEKLELDPRLRTNQERPAYMTFLAQRPPGGADRGRW